MAENKTKETKQSVTAFLNGIEDPNKRKDAKLIAKIMRTVSGERAKMWGPAIVGYGNYHYTYASGREGNFMRMGFSPRKQNMVVYIMPGFSGSNALLKKLGKHKIGKSCLYLNKLENIDIDVLTTLIQKSYAEMNKKYPK